MKSTACKLTFRLLNEGGGGSRREEEEEESLGKLMRKELLVVKVTKCQQPITSHASCLVAAYFLPSTSFHLILCIISVLSTKLFFCALYRMPLYIFSL